MIQSAQKGAGPDRMQRESPSGGWYSVSGATIEARRNLQAQLHVSLPAKTKL